MATRAEIEAQKAELEAQLAAFDEDDVELWVEADGKSTRLKGAQARRWLKKLGIEDDEPAAGDGDPDEDPQPPKTAMRARFFESK